MNRSLLQALVLITGLKAVAPRIRAIWGALKEFAPYAVIEFVLPGGTVLAILYWLYRRRRVVSAPVGHAPLPEIS